MSAVYCRAHATIKISRSQIRKGVEGTVLFLSVLNLT